MYYINPWVFYLISLVANIQIACVAVGASGAIIWFIGLLIGPMIIDGATDTTEKKRFILKLSGSG